MRPELAAALSDGPTPLGSRRRETMSSPSSADPWRRVMDLPHSTRRGPARAPIERPPLMSETDASRRSARPGLVIVYTGNGKGKTTAALGLAFRALGRGREVAMVQFIKGEWKTGEREFARTLPGLTFLVMGEGFTWESDDLAVDRRAAEKAWDAAEEMILAGKHFVVILDEITYAINYGFIPLERVIQTLRDRPEQTHVVVTGRDAPDAVVELADLVSEMTPIKHPFESGIRAQPGIDF